MFGQADRPIVPGPVSGQCLSQIRIPQKRIGPISTHNKNARSPRDSHPQRKCSPTRVPGSGTAVAANFVRAGLPILDERAGLLG